MPWLKKKSDPLSERARALNSEIAALEAQIRQLDATLSQPAPPRTSGFRSTAMPRGATIPHTTTAASPLPVPSGPPPRCPPQAHEPVFEEVGPPPLQSAGEPATTPEHFNDLGVRKFDVAASVRWLRNLFRRPPPMNPRLVSYLAAGGVQGLQPLRKEKRVARNRFILFVIFLMLVLTGTLWMFLHNR